MLHKLLLLLLSVSPLAPPGSVEDSWPRPYLADHRAAEGIIYMQMKRTLAALVTVVA
jgi:hypothetical protein